MHTYTHTYIKLHVNRSMKLINSKAISANDPVDGADVQSMLELRILPTVRRSHKLMRYYNLIHRIIFILSVGYF